MKLTRAKPYFGAAVQMWIFQTGTLDVSTKGILRLLLELTWQQVKVNEYFVVQPA